MLAGSMEHAIGVLASALEATTVSLFANLVGLARDISVPAFEFCPMSHAFASLFAVIEKDFFSKQSDFISARDRTPTDYIGCFTTVGVFVIDESFLASTLRHAVGSCTVLCLGVVT